MTRADARGLSVCLALLIAPAAVGCVGTETDGGIMIGNSNNSALLIYSNPYAPADPTTPNPIQGTASATATAYDLGGRMRIRLRAQGFPPSYAFGSHLHKLPCDDAMKAGGHYQHNPWQSGPMGTVATDPAYANTKNEAWLDFTTDADGKGGSELLLDWVPRPGEAKAVIIHQMPSQVAPAGGAAGAKLACLPMAFSN
jgi:superoxide dismutase, Cu-Zn family